MTVQPEAYDPPIRGTLLGLDIGGSGSRVAVVDADGGSRRELTGPRVGIGAQGSSVTQVVGELIARAVESWPQELTAVAGVGIGATGLASLVEDPTALADSAGKELDAPAAASIDAVTAHLGALPGSGGAIVALGTGAIAISHPGLDATGRCPASWRRIDGWGHLLGDRGGGAWLGLRALEKALRAYDGIDAAGAGLLTAGRQRYGNPTSWPAQLYTRADRAGVIAEFAVDVVGLAQTGDAAAARLVVEAGHEAARSALAALETDFPAHVVLTGGLAQAGDVLTDAFVEEITAARNDVTVRESAGDPLAGALSLARLIAAGRIEPQDGFVWLKP